MVLSFSPTVFTKAPPPEPVSKVTLALIGQTVLSSPSSIAVHVDDSSSDVFGLMILNGGNLYFFSTRLRYFLKMWLGPDPSARTIGLISLVEHSSVGGVASISSSSAATPSGLVRTPPQVLISPVQISASVLLPITRRPPATPLPAVQPFGRWTMIATAPCSTGTVFNALFTCVSISLLAFLFGGSSVATNAVVGTRVFPL